MGLIKATAAAISGTMEDIFPGQSLLLILRIDHESRTQQVGLAQRTPDLQFLPDHQRAFGADDSQP